MKKKVLIIGSRGMAGHTIFQYLDSLNKYELINTARQKFNKDTLIIDVVRDINFLERVIINSQPDIIINCVGILVKDSKKYPQNAWIVNAVFPHTLVDITKNMKTKIIHISTDCVFDGKKGNYSETDIPNETNVYGKTKVLGEIIDNKHLTLRLSIIGDELKRDGSGLFEWFLRQEGDIEGYTKAIWSGITTFELAKQIDRIINTKLIGLYHLAPDFKISKYDLLKLIDRIWEKWDVYILKNDTFRQDKTLINNRKKEYNPKIPNYKTQLIEMKEFIERKR